MISQSVDAPAKYKIEVVFNKNRTSAGPNVVALSAWESGARLDGEGDEMMYMCAERDKGLALNTVGVKDKEVVRGKEGCGRFIPGNNIRQGVAICPCEKKRLLNTENLSCHDLVSLTTEELATRLVSWFEKLESNADIYVKYHPTDIRYKAMADAEGLDKARSLRGLTIYPLKNIIKDITAGSSLQRRFYALLSC